MNGRLDDRAAGSKGLMGKVEGARRSPAGGQAAWLQSIASERACLAGSWHKSLSLFLRLDEHVAFSPIAGGDDIYKWGTGAWILKRNRLGVPFCNALFTSKAGLR